MSQEHNNLFNPTNSFQPSPFNASLLQYPTELSLQFASTVPPHRPAFQRTSPITSNFNHFPTQDALIQPQHFMHHSYPGSPYERPDKLPQTKAEKRAEHNAIERARRESLNSKFQQLAFVLPNLQNDTRPSKSTIIDRTLDFVKSAIEKEKRYQSRIQELEKFNSYLLSESENRQQKKRINKSHQQRQQQHQLNLINDSSSDEEEDDDEEEEVEQELKIEPQEKAIDFNKQSFSSPSTLNGVSMIVPPTSVSIIPNQKQTTCSSNNNNNSPISFKDEPQSFFNHSLQSQHQFFQQQQFLQLNNANHHLMHRQH